MTTDAPLEILDIGAVTAVGLSAEQTCAAVRAKVKRFGPIEAQIVDYQEPRVGARVSADPRLRADEDTWLLNLAGRALLDVTPEPNPGAALLWLLPEAHRGYALSAARDEELLERLCAHVGRNFSPASRVFRKGAAECVEALGVAGDLLRAGTVDEVIIGAADSLLRLADFERLAHHNRLLGPKQPQGILPGEGAACVRVGLGQPRADEREGPDAGEGSANSSATRVIVHGVGIGLEDHTVLGTEYSLADGYISALTTARHACTIAEPEIDFVSGNFNGERYDAWEMAQARARGYPTRREHFPSLWPAGSTGDLGAAGGVLALVVTAAALRDGYAPGTTAAVHVRSDCELRGVALLRAHGA